MKQAESSLVEKRYLAEIAGRVVLEVLTQAPLCATAQVLREVLAVGVTDWVERALFAEVLGNDPEWSDVMLRAFKLDEPKPAPDKARKVRPRKGSKKSQDV